MTRNIEISFCLPCYGDGRALAVLLPRLNRLIHQRKLAAEILVLDDGSPDGSWETLKELRRQINRAEKQNTKTRRVRLRLFRHRQNRGYGLTLGRLFLLAHGKYIFYTDGDYQYPLTGLARFIEKRHTLPPGDWLNGKKIKRAEGLSRLISSRIYSVAVWLCFPLAWTTAREINTDYRMFFRSRLGEPGSRPPESDLLFPLWLVLTLSRGGGRPHWQPVHHRKRPFGRSAFLPKLSRHPLTTTARLIREWRSLRRWFA